MSINDDSREHRAQPVDFALKVIHQVFGHYMTPDDSMSVWELQLKNGMWYADDALHCLRELVANPPDALGERIRSETDNTVVLSNYIDPKPDGFDDADYLAWLRDMVPQLQRRFDQVLSRQTPEEVEDEEIDWTDAPKAAERELLAEVPFWATDVSSRVESASEEYGSGAWRVVVKYTLPYR